MEERFTRKAQRKNISFEEAADRFISVQKGRGNSPATINHYKRTIKKLCKFFCWLAVKNEKYDSLADEEKIKIGMEQSVSIFDKSGIECDLRTFLTEAGNMNSVTVNTYFRDYRVIAYWLAEENFINGHKIVIKAVEPNVKKVYTDEEIAKLLKKPKADCGFAEYRNWVIIHHFLATGNRISTICAIKIEDVDWDDSMLAVQVQKNKRKTRIPIEETYMKVLKEYVDLWLTDENGEYITEFLFPSAYLNSEEKLNRITLSKSIADYNRSRNVLKTSTHLFRHTFAKHWILAGKDLHSLQKMLGHSTLEMVTHYANLYDTDLKPKVEEHSILREQKNKTKNAGRLIQQRGK